MTNNDLEKRVDTLEMLFNGKFKAAEDNFRRLTRHCIELEDKIKTLNARMTYSEGVYEALICRIDALENNTPQMQQNASEIIPPDDDRDVLIKVKADYCDKGYFYITGQYTDNEWLAGYPGERFLLENLMNMHFNLHRIIEWRELPFD